MKRSCFGAEKARISPLSSKLFPFHSPRKEMRPPTFQVVTTLLPKKARPSTSALVSAFHMDSWEASTSVDTWAAWVVMALPPDVGLGTLGRERNGVQPEAGRL